MKPLKTFFARQVTATTTAQSVFDCLTAAEQSALDGKSSVTIFNPSTTQLNVGGQDVDNSTKFVPISTATTSVSDRISVDADFRMVKFRTATGTLTVYVLFGGGNS